MKQWSLILQGGEDSVRDYVQFLWQEGQGGKQIEYDASGTEEYEVQYSSTDTFDGFVKWAFECATQLQEGGYRFAMSMPGCPQCGTILNAEAADCDSLWHAENQTGALQLSLYMFTNFPDAVTITEGDPFRAALNLLRTTSDAIGVVWPILVGLVKDSVGILRRVGIPLPMKE